MALRFRDGAEARADLLIGADGLRSTVRRLLFDDGPPRAGYGAWLGLSDTDHPRLSRESAVEIYGAGERLGVIDSGDGLYYWYFIENRAQPVDGVVHCTAGSLLPRLADWPDYARQLATSTRARSLQYLSFFHRPARRGPWGRDRALLLGDAIHPPAQPGARRLPGHRGRACAGHHAGARAGGSALADPLSVRAGAPHRHAGTRFGQAGTFRPGRRSHIEPPARPGAAQRARLGTRGARGSSAAKRASLDHSKSGMSGSQNRTSTPAPALNRAP